MNEYVKKVIALVGDDDPLQVLESTAEKVAQLVRSARPDQFHISPGQGEWSPAQVIGHLADSEMVYGVRVRMILTEDNPAIPGYDQDAWADRVSRLEDDLEAAVERFKALRQANLRLYRSLTEEEWKRSGMHSERGPESIEMVVKLLAGHDLMHTEQLQKAFG